MPRLNFAGYDFAIQVLARRHLYEPLDLEVRSTANGLEARATELVFGEGTQHQRGCLEVRMWSEGPDAIRWQVHASAPEPIKGIKVQIEGLPNGSLIIPCERVGEIADGQLYCAVFPNGFYPTRSIPTSSLPDPHLPWVFTQFVAVEAQDRTFALRSEDYPPRPQRYWFRRQGDRLRLTVYSEASASQRAQDYVTPTWSLEQAPDWRAVVDRHVEWMQRAYGLRPLAERADVPDWLRGIALNVTLHGDANDGKLCHTFAEMEDRLRAVARYFDPHRTHVHVVGWDGRWDYTWPAYEPDPLLGGREGFRRFVATAHELGYHVGLHLNVWGLGYDHPDFDKLSHFLEHQVRDSEDQPLSWAYDWDGDEVDEQIFAYISPDHEPWRRHLRGQIVKLVCEYGIDTVYLDQATSYVNDRRHDHWRGVCSLYRELRAELPPNVALGGEATHEIVAQLYPLAGFRPSRFPELRRRLFGRFVRQFTMGFPPEPRRGVSLEIKATPRWSREAFHEHLSRAEENELIPCLLFSDRHVRVDSEEARAVFAAAERLRTRLAD